MRKRYWGKNMFQPDPAYDQGQKISDTSLEEVPGMFAFIGAGQPGNAPLHNPHMVLDEEVLPLGAALHAYTAISWLDFPQIGG